MTPRLTLSYGLRYEYNSPFTAADGNVYSFDLANGSVVVPNAHSETYFSKYFPASIPVITAAQANVPASLREANKLNLAPRFGFSYQLDDSGKTVIRGGWGLYYLHFSADLAAFLATVLTPLAPLALSGESLFIGRLGEVIGNFTFTRPRDALPAVDRNAGHVGGAAEHNPQFRQCQRDAPWFCERVEQHDQASL